MDGVVTLHKPAPANDVPATLRRIADELEAGTLDWPVTTAVVVFGHTGPERPSGDERRQRNHWTTYGFGPRADSFTIRGLLSSVILDDFSQG